jgi:hypothetical protein
MNLIKRISNFEIQIRVFYFVHLVYNVKHDNSIFSRFDCILVLFFQNEILSHQMNTKPPFLKQIVAQLKKPFFLGPLAFVGGTFWIHTILNNFNSEKCHTSLFRGLIYEMKNQGSIVDMFGSDLHYDPDKHSRVKGTFDNFKGFADLEFTIQGSNGKGIVHFVGNRYSKTDCWISSQFIITKFSELGEERVEL